MYSISVLHSCGQKTQLPRKHPDFGSKKRKREANELNWRKKSIFLELLYWPSLLLRYNLDIMHVEKNVCDSLLGIILNIMANRRTLITHSLIWQT